MVCPLGVCEGDRGSGWGLCGLDNTHPAWLLPTAIADKKGKGGAERAPFNLSARRAPSRRGKGCPRGGPQPKEGDGGRLSPVGWVRGAFPLGECEGDRGSGWGLCGLDDTHPAWLSPSGCARGSGEVGGGDAGWHTRGKPTEEQGDRGSSPQQGEGTGEREAAPRPRSAEGARGNATSPKRGAQARRDSGAQGGSRNGAGR